MKIRGEEDLFSVEAYPRIQIIKKLRRLQRLSSKVRFIMYKLIYLFSSCFSPSNVGVGSTPGCSFSCCFFSYLP